MTKIFVPGSALGAKSNYSPDSNLNDKLWNAIRRHISNNSFTDGPIKDQTPMISIKKYKFNNEAIGYDVDFSVS